MTPACAPKVTVFYHYYYPDDVTSARQFQDLCEGLAVRGFMVETLPCNRGSHDEKRSYAAAEVHQQVRIRRIWRPAFKQSSGPGRILNALWMIGAWSLDAFRRRKDLPDYVVVGTDPILSILVAIVFRAVRPSVRIAHWCFDLYPEAAIEDGLLRRDSAFVRLSRRLLRVAYRSCDLIVDLGPCMRTRLEAYGSCPRRETLTPWALIEPERPAAVDPNVRRELFGDARLGILYSGNLGRAHNYGEFLQLAERLRDDSARFCFGVRGHRVDALRSEVGTRHPNIGFAGFASEEELEKRLGAADIHLTSLRPEWTGLVVPSKFFGSLAVGRPVIFAGKRDSALAKWIDEYGVGWILDQDSIDAVVSDLRDMIRRPERIVEMQRRCHDVYKRRFSRALMLDRWAECLGSLHRR
jgi:glycosyltransferase involved in cell wall biosynthesis